MENTVSPLMIMILQCGLMLSVLSIFMLFLARKDAITFLKRYFRPFFDMLDEMRKEKEREDRQWRHYLKKISRVEHRIAKGADYRVGDDGEIVVINPSDNAKSNPKFQINEDGELTSTKDST
jgi:hypothetical protein